MSTNTYSSNKTEVLRVEDKDLEFLSILLQRKLLTAFCGFCSKDIGITGGGKKSQDAHVLPDMVKKSGLDSAMCSSVLLLLL